MFETQIIAHRPSNLANATYVNTFGGVFKVLVNPPSGPILSAFDVRDEGICGHFHLFVVYLGINDSRLVMKPYGSSLPLHHVIVTSYCDWGNSY